MKKFCIAFVFITLVSSSWYLLSPYISSETIPGWGLDPYFCVYVIKQVVSQLDLGIYPLESKFWDIPMFFPAKRVLAFSDPFILQGFFVFILQKIFSLSFFLSVNLVFVTFFLLNLIFCFLFYSVYIRSYFISIIAAWLWTFSVYFLVQSAHYQNTAAVGIVMTLYFSTKVNKKMNQYVFFWIPISFIVLVTSNLYNFVFTIFVIPSFWLFEIYRKFNKQPLTYKLIVIRNYLCSIFVSIFVTFPILYRYYETRQMYPEFLTQRNFWEQTYSSARLVDYVSITGNFERTAFPGLFTFLIFLVSLFIFFYFVISDKNSQTYPRYSTKGMVLVFVLLVLGSFLASGAHWFPNLFQFVSEVVPGLSGLRAIGRAGVIVVLAECLAVGIFLHIIYRKNKFFLFLLLCILVALQIHERLIHNFRNNQILIKNADIHKSKITHFLKGKKGDLAIFEVSSDGSQQIKFSLERGLFHELPIITGYSGFSPYSHYDVFKIYGYLEKCNLDRLKNNKLLKHSHFIILHEKKQERLYSMVGCLEQLDFKTLIKNKNQTLFRKIIY